MQGNSSLGKWYLLLLRASHHLGLGGRLGWEWWRAARWWTSWWWEYESEFAMVVAARYISQKKCHNSQIWFLFPWENSHTNCLFRKYTSSGYQQLMDCDFSSVDVSWRNCTAKLLKMLRCSPFNNLCRSEQCLLQVVVSGRRLWVIM